MIEYPTIINSSKAPRKNCIAFDKLDGSNIRVKWTNNKGFTLFGSRHCLIDNTHPHLGEVVEIFNRDFNNILDNYFRKEKEFRNQREIIVFGEFLGPNSYAGIHNASDKKEFYVFDVLVGHKNQYFISPQEFVKTIANIVQTPKVVYSGNLNDQFIADVRNNKYNLKEGVICKGTEKSGAFRGKIWMCKIKTQAYLDSLKAKFGAEWEKYAE